MGSKFPSHPRPPAPLCHRTTVDGFLDILSEMFYEFINTSHSLSVTYKLEKNLYNYVHIAFFTWQNTLDFFNLSTYRSTAFFKWFHSITLSEYVIIFNHIPLHECLGSLFDLVLANTTMSIFICFHLYVKADLSDRSLKVKSLVKGYMCLVTQLCPTLFNPRDCSPPGSLVYGFSRQEYWNGLHTLLQGIFLTQGLNPGFQHYRQIFLLTEPPRKPMHF